MKSLYLNLNVHVHSLRQAILEQRDPDEEEVEFFNQYTAKIDEARNNMYALQRELDNLEYRQFIYFIP